MKVTICCLLSFATSALALAQDFGPQQVITIHADGARSVYAADLDGDGDADVLSASKNDDKIAWYENRLNESTADFGPQKVITLIADGAQSVFAIDLDGDGDIDVLSASGNDDTIAWYENQGGGFFSGQRVISDTFNVARCVYAKDLDGDGDADVLAASIGSGLAWYENLGGGAFGGEYVIDTSGARHVYAEDLDGDGDADVLSAMGDSTVWHENPGDGQFGKQWVIDTAGASALAVYAADLDGDGDSDVLSGNAGGWGTGEVSNWHQNLGPDSGSIVRWGNRQEITKLGTGTSVFATDLDGDGDKDVLLAANGLSGIKWCKNRGPGPYTGGPRFELRPWITEKVNKAWSVFAIDLDGDGDADVLSASSGDNKIAWYENLMGDCNGNGLPDDQDIADGTSSDCDANGRPDECDIADEPSLDCDFNGQIDSCEFKGDPSLDCDANGILDKCELASDPTLDWNGDGVLDECTPPNYCTANPNGSGLPGVMSASGSPLIANNDFTMTASQLPSNEWGFFLMADSQGFIPNVGGSSGNLCLGFPLYRFVKPPKGQVLNSGSGGTFSFSPDLGNLPQGVVFQVGETWDFQAWFRDWNGSNTSNFTDGIEVMFR